MYNKIFFTETGKSIPRALYFLTSVRLMKVLFITITRRIRMKIAIKSKK